MPFEDDAEVSPGDLFRAYNSSDAESENGDAREVEDVEGEERIGGVRIVKVPLEPGKRGGREIVIEEDVLPGCGGRTWESAFLLTSYLTRHPAVVRQKRVLELGCGTGVVGLVAAGLGAREVVLTDLECMLDVARRNVEVNRGVLGGSKVDGEVAEGDGATTPGKANGGGDNTAAPHARVIVRELAWGSDLSPEWWAAERLGTVIPAPPSSPPLAPTTTPTPPPLDIILAADCVYLESCFDPLLKTLLDLTASPSQSDTGERTEGWKPPEVIVAYKKRWRREKRFWKTVKKEFLVEIIDTDVRPTYEKENLVIYSLRRKPTPHTK
ncbi:hypothetical protein M427DRAFT_73145 [Gonapodya prolifera JEL478]|uniref:Protein-lysine N-methyltransferase EFM6 n=1 Tax=Gonapodya prolifera (strain JEL478) TaxID=1344416 RepID=A0A139A2Z0_GONPJ|nr:hypothetical protein M427DRAFT_73145 [Gonapodya prolifera JEL478]|eukprot:KXS11176.1 hypothetical protein M427DRAFT_73145 [Gonapodya prolifera JEL478]